MSGIELQRDNDTALRGADLAVPPSYHGKPDGDRNDYLVHTEYGADAWRQVLAAGFVECRIVAVRPPAAHALVGIKGTD